MTAERNGNGNYKIIMVAVITLLVGLISGYVVRHAEGSAGNDELRRRMDVAERYADEYRRDVSQINGRIAVIESKVTMILEKKGG